MVRHFLKIFFIFLVMIVVGLMGVFLAGYFDKSGEQSTILNSAMSIFK